MRVVSLQSKQVYDYHFSTNCFSGYSGFGKLLYNIEVTQAKLLLICYLLLKLIGRLVLTSDNSNYATKVLPNLVRINNLMSKIRCVAQYWYAFLSL